MGWERQVVLKGRGGTFRLEGGTVRVVRGRGVVEIPLRAVEAVEQGEDERSVGLRISGGGPGAAFTVRSGNTSAVRAFTEALERALAGVTPVADGQALITARTRPVEPPRLSTRASRVTALVAGWLTVIVVAAVTAREPAQRALVLTAAFTAPLGSGLLAVAWRFFLRDPWILRRRGVTVPGEIVDYITSRKQQAKYPVYRFTTVTGVTRTQESSVSVLTRRANPRVDVTYDPQDPARVRGGRAIAHLGAGLFLGVLGTGAVLGALMALISW
ncbi:hypothetical protein SUDANB105_04377 [Streptomyces sp. enrichment culture]|uniref:DUF3592 domain-containing protein n=1 Tax=Streptomyces sp. enrichment culture TaxID=1795815 RepID=UPI003F55C2F8